MEKLRSKRPAEDFNGNTAKSRITGNDLRNTAKIVKDTLVAADGRVFYPCSKCNEIFPIRKARMDHAKHCPFGQSSPLKIDIKQNIVLNDSDVKPSRRSPRSGTEAPELDSPKIDGQKPTAQFSQSAIGAEKQDSCSESDDEKTSDSNFVCSQCKCEFDTSMELLRHTRRCSNYPKVIMASSEVKKYFAMDNRSKCPICDKPMKTTFKSAFIKHLTTHTNEMNYECSICRLKFRRKDHMKAHEKRHVFPSNP